MKSYLVSCPKGWRYAGSMTEVKEKRNELMEKFEVKKKDVEIAEIEIPTNKADLLIFLNDLLEHHDLPSDDMEIN